MVAPTFAPPGPGAWELDSTHLTRPLTGYMAALYPDGITNGFSAGAKDYGVLLGKLEVKAVNGFNYICPRGVGAPDSAVGPPPKLIFKLLGMVHPELRRRYKAAETALATKRWRQDLATWDTRLKPAAIARQLALVAVDPATLDDAGLAAHLEDCRANLVAMLHQHHSLSIACLIPVADYLLHVQDWTGLTADKVLPTLTGASPESVNCSPGQAALVEGLRADPAALALLRDRAPADALAALRAREDAIGAGARQYLDCTGYQAVHGYDVGDPYGWEMPELLVRGILDAIDRKPCDGGAAAIARIRALVPPAHQATFDELLGEARLIYRLRDERTLYSDLWASGIARRGLLEAGRRLVAAGRLADAGHMVEAHPDEVRELLAGRGPAGDELARRAAYRAAHTTADAPEFLGPTPGGPPPADWLPTPAARRVHRATMLVLDGIFQVSKAQHEPLKLNGLAVGGGSYEGPARIVLGPEDFDRIRPGDVLVTRATSPTFNIVLPQLGAIVTDRGGTLCHAAIVAREYGLPAVVGTRDATKTLKDGQRVRVDGDAGVVEVLG